MEINKLENETSKSLQLGENYAQVFKSIGTSDFFRQILNIESYFECETY